MIYNILSTKKWLSTLKMFANFLTEYKSLNSKEFPLARIALKQFPAIKLASIENHCPETQYKLLIICFVLPLMFVPCFVCCPLLLPPALFSCLLFGVSINLLTCQLLKALRKKANLQIRHKKVFCGLTAWPTFNFLAFAVILSFPIETWFGTSRKTCWPSGFNWPFYAGTWTVLLEVSIVLLWLKTIDALVFIFLIF